jgi:3-mercaptopyruvate sulfurtransferase SseA
MRLFISIAAMILVAAVLFTACNSNELATQKSQNATPPTQPQTPPPAADTTRRITPAELKDKLAKNEAILIDVRGEAAYKASHIKGSLQIPYAEVAPRSDELPKDKLIVTYCS